MNTGAPQGCVLSAFLFTMYTNDLSRDDALCKIAKYADDTVIIGLVKNNDESSYREAIEFVADWCKQFYLNLNVKKTKEVIFDFRKSQPKHLPARINGDEVDMVENFKYLGVTLDCSLKWDIHIQTQLSKVNKRFYHVRCLLRTHVDKRIICMFYNAVISSVLLYAATCWYGSCSAKCKKNVDRIYRRMCRLIGPDHENLINMPSQCYDSRTLALAKKLATDTTHPLNIYFNLLPSGRRYSSLRSRTTRFRNTTVPTCIRSLNS